MENLYSAVGHSGLLNHLAQLIFSNGLNDLRCVFLSSQKRLGEFVCLLRRDLAGHGWLVRIDDCLNENRSGVRKHFTQGAFGILWLLESEAARAASLSNF